MIECTAWYPIPNERKKEVGGGNSYNFAFCLQFPETETGWKRYITTTVECTLPSLSPNCGVVEVPEMTSQPLSSIFVFFFCFPLSSGTCCCLPTSSSVCLVFFPLSLCLARWFWPDLMNGRHDHITAACVSLRSSGGLRVVRLPAGTWHGLPRW